MNKQEIIAILRSAPSRDIKFPIEEPKPVEHPTITWLEEHGMVYSVSEGIIEVHGNIVLSNQGLEKLPVDFSMCVIDGVFTCRDNNLTSLEGCPKVVQGYFDCSQNKLTTLEGCPKFVVGCFRCRDNSDLKNLKHIPKSCKNYYTDFNDYQYYGDIPTKFL